MPLGRMCRVSQRKIQRRQYVMRAKKVEEAIRLAWSSLESHLQYTHKRSWEGKSFHQKCTREYSRIIQILTELY